MDRLREKFKQQQAQKQQASKLNLDSIREEAVLDQTSKSATMHSTQQWKQHRANKLKQLIEADEKGIDLTRIKNVNYTLQQTEEWKQHEEWKEAVGRDPGFTDLNQLGCRKYRNLLDSLPKKRLGTEREAVESLAQEARLTQKRLRSNRHRTVGGEPTDDEDVTFINERNLKFNKKVARFYDRYTQEIQESFERGTNI